MCKYLATLTMLTSLIACRPTPFEIRPTAEKAPFKVHKTTSEHGAELSSEQKDKIRRLYKEAKSPTVALVNGFYRLPNAKPFGAAQILRGHSFNTFMEGIVLKGREQPFAITPIEGQEAIALNNAMNALLDAGVKFKEISLADALALAEAENLALKKEGTLALRRYLPPTVDWLMSVYKTDSDRGPVLVGRVVAKDGRLLAFRVIENGDHPDSLSALIIALFEDTLNRL